MRASYTRASLILAFVSLAVFAGLYAAFEEEGTVLVQEADAHPGAHCAAVYDQPGGGCTTVYSCYCSSGDLICMHASSPERCAEGAWTSSCILHNASVCAGGGNGDTPPPPPTPPTVKLCIGVDMQSCPKSKTVQVGDRVTLKWQSSNASGCTAIGSWGGSKPTSGTEGQGPYNVGNKTLNYHLDCSGAGGSDSDQVSVTVAGAPKHNACRDQQCVQVDGDGSDQCYPGIGGQCQRKACEGTQCVLRNGVGENDAGCRGGADDWVCGDESDLSACGDIGGTLCVHDSGGCPDGYTSAGNSSDCVSCCKQVIIDPPPGGSRCNIKGSCLQNLPQELIDNPPWWLTTTPCNSDPDCGGEPTCSLAASPNPCTIAAGNTACTSTIAWDTNAQTDIWVRENGGPRAGPFASVAGTSGTKAAPWISAGTTYTFEGVIGGNVACTVNVTGISVPQPDTLTVDLTAALDSANWQQSLSGTAPLNGVDLRASVGGTAAGTINYTFYCNRSDTGTNIEAGHASKIDGTSANPLNVGDVCNYEDPGTFWAKVIAERGGIQAEDRVRVDAAWPQPTVNLEARPSIVPEGFASQLEWVSRYADSCSASGEWNGAKATSGSESTGPLAFGLHTYNLSCAGPAGSAADTATVKAVCADECQIRNVDGVLKPDRRCLDSRHYQECGADANGCLKWQPVPPGNLCPDETPLCRSTSDSETNGRCEALGDFKEIPPLATTWVREIFARLTSFLRSVL